MRSKWTRWNRYRSLKLRIMIRTVGTCLLIGGAGYAFVFWFMDGVLHEPFASGMVDLFQYFGLDEANALNLYREIFRENKDLIIGVGLLILLLCGFYLSMSRFTTYLRKIEQGIQMILEESSNRIELSPELQPLEDQLNAIKGTLMEQRRQTQESEQRKNDLVVYLAHDLKTPLTSVIAYLSLLDEAPDMPLDLRVKYTGISLVKAKRLGDLINEFFEITRYNLQDITLDQKAFYLYVLLEQVLDSFLPVFEERGLTCNNVIDSRIHLYGDPDKLARVFENLLRNAVVYCEKASEIQVFACQKGDKAEISIGNYGKDIPQHQMDHLFEKFYRLDEARSSRTGGAGLGLAIAKEIVELHHGVIQAKSSHGYTKFTVILPIDQKGYDSKEAL